MLDTKIKEFHESILCFMKWSWNCISWNALKERFHSVSLPSLKRCCFFYMTSLSVTLSTLKTSMKFWGTAFKFYLCPCLHCRHLLNIWLGIYRYLYHCQLETLIMCWNVTIITLLKTLLIVPTKLNYEIINIKVSWKYSTKVLFSKTPFQKTLDVFILPRIFFAAYIITQFVIF